jgi:hypothetical protein
MLAMFPERKLRTAYNILVVRIELKIYIITIKPGFRKNLYRPCKIQQFHRRGNDKCYFFHGLDMNVQNVKVDELWYAERIIKL